MVDSPVPFESHLFLYSDKALKQLVRLIRDTDMGTRKDRQQREALRRDDPEQEQHGEERQEDGLNEKEWERDLYEIWHDSTRRPNYRSWWGRKVEDC
jgi:hypothetical protein